VAVEGTEIIPACTVRFAAPEVAASRLANRPVRITAAIDVWAMALVLFQLFTGASLWDDIEVDEDLVANKAEVAVAKLQESQALTQQQKRLLQVMLVVQPEDRMRLSEVLKKSFFNEVEDTEQSKSIEILALFSSPTKFSNGRSIALLQMMQEIDTLQA